MAQSWDVATHESNEKVKMPRSSSKFELELDGQSHNFSNIVSVGLTMERALGP